MRIADGKNMRRVTTISALHLELEAARAGRQRVGLVPTMGALHGGHAELIRQAAAATDLVVVTIFVNPLQFAATDDLAVYPRDLDGDHAIAQAAGAALLFCPTVDEMYPFGPSNVLTNVRVRGVADQLEGTHRPGHFDGVATVVAKLFAIVGACTAFFGEKDYQQLAVVRRMATDLSFQIKIVGVPTVRESNGLAMSSRNRYLTREQRDGAAVISQAMFAARSEISGGVRDFERIRGEVQAQIAASPVVSSIDYVAIVDAATLETAGPQNPVRILVACKVGTTRLIDNG